ncbi:MAG: GumC family protein [Candidatus Acidiferrales bacterium]
MEPADKLALFEPARAVVERKRAELLRPGPPSTIEQDPNLQSYWRVIQKRRWTILSIVLIVFTVVLIATLKEKQVYRSRAMIEIDKENPNILTVQEMFQLENESDAYLETQFRIVQSESVAKRVIAELHLDQMPEFNPRPQAWPWSRNRNATSGTGEAASDPTSEQEVLQRFEDRLTIEPVKQSRLLQINFESENPRLAAQIANSVTKDYIEENLENRWNATEKATEWLGEQLQDVKGKLEKSEDDLQQYAQTNGLLFLESNEGKSENILDERLRQLQEELTKAQGDLYGKESLYRLVQSGEISSLPGIVDSQLVQSLTLRLSDLQASYAQLATTFSPDYPKVKQLKSEIDKTQEMVTNQQKQIAGKITDEYLAAARREKLVRDAFEQQQREANRVAGEVAQYNILKREVDTNKQLYDGLLQRMKEAGVSAGLKASNIRIVDPATAPVSPVKPRLGLNLVLGMLVGLFCGVGVAFLQEQMDNTLKTSEDVERFLQLPALAAIPARESLNGNRRGLRKLQLPGQLPVADEGNGNGASRTAGWVRIDEIAKQYSALPEAFRSLRTSVLLSTADQPPRSLLITSAQPGEGKTTISINLSISLAQLGQRVLLMDADLRRPSVHKAFQVPPGPGLVSYLTGRQEWTAVVVPTTVKGLDLIPSGPVPPNPVELLSSERLKTLLEEAMGRYSMVLIDSPPLLNVTDGRVISVVVEGVVLVVRGNVTQRALAQRARAHALDVGANIIGAVLNNVDARHDDYHYYYYSDYYHSPSEEEQTNAKNEG